MRKHKSFGRNCIFANKYGKRGRRLSGILKGQRPCRWIRRSKKTTTTERPSLGQVDYPLFRARIFKLLRNRFHRIRNRFHRIDSATLCSLACLYYNPISTRFPAHIDCSKISAQAVPLFPYPPPISLPINITLSKRQVC